jgi:hypothetical protein
MKKDQRQHLTDLRATLPAPLEVNTDTAWQEFQQLQAKQEEQFDSTKPLTGPAPLSLRKAAAAAKPAAKITLDQALLLARSSNRVCPMPQHWKAMFELLQQLAPPKTVAPSAVEGAAWNVVPPMQKRLRLREQLEWADRHGVLHEVCGLLASLPEDAWLHF